MADDIPDRSTVKTCTECGQPKPLDSFSPSRLGKHGRRSKCRECCRTLASAYRAANPERARASVNAYHVANHDGILAQKRAYYAANREAERARIAADRKAHHAARLAYGAAYRAANADTIRMRAAAYRAARPDRARASVTAWRAAHPEAWRANLHRQRGIRRARQAGAPTVERIDRAAIWKRDGGHCHICHKPCNPNNWHLDHLVPLSRGGPHTAANVAVSHPRCNNSRGTRGPAQLRLGDLETQ